MSSIEFEIRDGIGRIKLNRPEVFNSVNKEMAMLWLDALQKCTDESVRAVLITGTGNAFCAGQDLNEVIDPNGPPLDSIVRDHYNPIVRSIVNLEKPVICAVNGIAAGAGANLALNCDIVIAKKSAKFMQAFSKIGLVPDSGGTYILPRIVGMQRAMGLMLLAEKISADDAEKMGMIYKSIEDDVFDETVENYISTLAQMPTKGLAMTKKLLQESFLNDLVRQLDREEELQTIAGQSHDYREGVAAFLEKRKPIFIGK